MATGDKNILAFANKDSLQHKQTRAYSAGSVCIKDGLFYEANDVIAGGTTFSEGTTGATWKLVGSKPIEDWVASTAYEVGDQVFAKESLWECKTTHTSGATFVKTNWTLKAGSEPTNDWVASTAYVVGDTVFSKGAVWECKTAHTSATTFVDTNWNLKAGIINELKWSSDTSGNINPVAKDTQSIGSDGKHLLSVHVQGVNFYASDGSYMGNIDADDNNLGIYSGDESNTTNELRFGLKNNVSDFKIQNSQILFEKKVKIEASLVTNQNIEIEAANGNKGIKLESSDDGGKVITDGNNLYLGSAGGSDWFLSGSGDLRPVSDNSRSLGNGTNRVKTIYSNTSTINTSDEREKSFVDIPEKLLEVWFDYVKPKMYKWNSDIEKDGVDGAEIHTGVAAQDVIKAFLAAGLDWTKYAVVYVDFESSCVSKDTFDYKDIDNLPPLSIRYDHVKIIEMAAIRRKIGV